MQLLMQKMPFNKGVGKFLKGVPNDILLQYSEIIVPVCFDICTKNECVS